MYRIGVLGCGNMGGALLAGLFERAHGEVELSCTTRSKEKFTALHLDTVRYLPDAASLAREVDCLLLCVKPYQVEAILAEIKEALSPKTLLCSIAAGVSLAKLKALLGRPQPCIRCMPDTPALVGEGVFALCASEEVDLATKERMEKLFSRLGLALYLPEERFAAFSALIGAGPAYVFQLMQAFVQAGVTLGFGHLEARTMVEALFKGSAVMAQKRPEHLMALRDAVCSPKGLTIDGVNELERRGVSGALIDAVFAANARGLAMEKE